MKKIFINENKQLRSGWKIILAIILPFIILFGLGIIVGIICSIMKISLDPQSINQIMSGTAKVPIQTALVLLQEIVPIVVCIVLWKALDKKSLNELGMTKFKGNWKKFMSGLVVGAVSLTVVTIILLVSGSAVMKGDVLKPDFSLSLIGSLIMYISVGFSEEILSRGYFLSVLKQCKRKWVPYVGSAVLFALLHSLNAGISFLAYINLFLFGLFLAYVVYKTKNLWFGIGVHITWNYFEGCVFGYLVSGGNISKSIYYLQNSQHEIINGGAFGPEGGLAVTLVLVVSILLVYKFCPKASTVEKSFVEVQ